MKRLVTICAMVLLAGCDDPMSPNVRLGYYELATRNGEEVPVAVDLPSSDGSIVITSFTYGSVHLLSGGRHATSLGVNVSLGDGSSAKGIIHFGPGDAAVTVHDVTLTLTAGGTVSGSFGGRRGNTLTVPFGEPFGTLVFLKQP